MMQHYTDRIRERARVLLEKGKVDVFIGYRKGTVPMMNSPVSVLHPEDAEILWWDSHCGLNLCNYLIGRSGRIGVIATGCNSRSIVNHLAENQLKREDIYIVGIPCTGMVDHRAVQDAVQGREIREVSENGSILLVKGPDFERTLEKGHYLQKNCWMCTHRNPVLFDELIDEPVQEQDGVDPYEDVAEVEEMNPDEKWEHFCRLVSPCIRCYACRNACPLCFCPTCFVDESRPQWVGKGLDATDTMTFHLLRAFHCAGRCTDCGACERVCPVGIEVRQFIMKLNKDVRKLFSCEAGLKPDEKPPLNTYRQDDYNDFIH